MVEEAEMLIHHPLFMNVLQVIVFGPRTPPQVLLFEVYRHK